MEARIAVVDDEDTLRENVTQYLRQQGWTIEAHHDGLEALQAFEHSAPDLAILDILMPRMDGRELLTIIRARWPRTRVIFLTSRDEEMDRIVGLELGADDYLGKPFSLRELAARVRAQLRRSESEPGSEAQVSGANSQPAKREPGAYQQPGAAHPEATAAQQYPPPAEQAGLQGSLPDSIAGLRVEPAAFRAWFYGHELDLTASEFRLLADLHKHRGQVRTRDQLIQTLYDGEAFITGRVIDTHIKRLRAKLHELRPDWDGIHTVYGVGYSLRAELA